MTTLSFAAFERGQEKPPRVPRCYRRPKNYASDDQNQSFDRRSALLSTLLAIGVFSYFMIA